MESSKLLFFLVCAVNWNTAYSSAIALDTSQSGLEFKMSKLSNVSAAQSHDGEIKNEGTVWTEGLNPFTTSAEWQRDWLLLAELEKETGSGCKCINDDCGCCVDMDVKLIHLHSSVCVNVSYLREQYGIRVSLSIGNKNIINEVLSAKNPPGICVGLPDLHKWASICLNFYNLDYSKDFSGCIEIKVQLLHIKLLEVHLGCFNFPLLPGPGIPPSQGLSTPPSHEMKNPRGRLPVKP